MSPPPYDPNAFGALAEHIQSCDRRYAALQDDVQELKSDIKQLLTAYNMGRGMGSLAKVAGALLAAGLAAMTIWRLIFPGPSGH